jgi:short subunit dehydrogenase-like uncharacterized protein
MANALLLLGATGFTGRLVLAYLKEVQPEVEIVLGARDLKKLARVQKEVGTAYRAVAVDAMDRDSLERGLNGVKTVCTTVGPYAKFGMPLAEACAARGVHYCDLTGEVTFMRRSIDINHTIAQKTGARIVHACGFDSIPSDLGVWLLAELAQKELGEALGETRMYIGPARGGVSGGTLASLTQLLAEARESQAVRALIVNPYGLGPAGEQGPDKHEDNRVHEVESLGGLVVGPFVMAQCNTRVVRRSNMLQDYRYGRSFEYSEEQIFGRGLKGTLFAYGVKAALALVEGLQSSEATAEVINRFMPKSGAGPSEEVRRKGFFKMQFHARSSRSQKELRARVEGKGDPGYAATAVMLGESALCLTMDPLNSIGGVQTPAVAMAAPLVTRLRKAGMTFEAEVVESKAA